MRLSDGKGGNDGKKSFGLIKSTAGSSLLTSEGSLPAVSFFLFFLEFTKEKMQTNTIFLTYYKQPSLRGFLCLYSFSSAGSDLPARHIASRSRRGTFLFLTSSHRPQMPDSGRSCKVQNVRIHGLTHIFLPKQDIGYL